VWPGSFAAIFFKNIIRWVADHQVESAWGLVAPAIASGRGAPEPNCLGQVVLLRACGRRGTNTGIIRTSTAAQKDRGASARVARRWSVNAVEYPHLSRNLRVHSVIRTDEIDALV